MPIARDRNRIFVKGLGSCSVRETEPSVGTSFLPLGYLDMSRLNDDVQREIVKHELGQVANVLAREQTAEFITNMQQTSIDEIQFKQNAPGKVHAVRYYGPCSPDIFHFYCFEQAIIDGNVPLEFARGKRILPMSAVAIDISDAKGYSVPLYYLYQGAKVISVENVELWVDPRLGYNATTNRLLDISGFGRHGLINSDFASIWTAGTPNRFLRFDGVNDQLDFGNILDLNATDDFLIEIWLRVQAADGVLQYALSKKIGGASADKGYSIRRGATNKLEFNLGDNTNSGIISTSSNVLQNVWKNFAVAVDRNGNGQGYLNGVADGSPVSFAGVGDSTASANLFIGKVLASFGQFDIGGMRIHNYGPGGLPTDIATVVQRHYNAEKAFYNL